MPIQRGILGALLSLALAACTQDASPGSPTPSSALAGSSSAPQATERPSASPAPAATPEFPAPAELQGTWKAVMASGSDIELEISETGYRIAAPNPFGAVSGPRNGRVEVDGDEITFSNSTTCVGDGRYRWSIEGDLLRFEPIGTDQCPNRAPTIAQIEYTRAE